jgi:hypothetical protein
MKKDNKFNKTIDKVYIKPLLLIQKGAIVEVKEAKSIFSERDSDSENAHYDQIAYNTTMGKYCPLIEVIRERIKKVKKVRKLVIDI